MNALPTDPPRLRVLQCITRLGLGGAERVAFSLVRELRSEIDFAVFTVHGASADALGATMRAELQASQIPWFRGTRAPMKCGGMAPGGLALARVVREFRPDVVHYHSETPEACGAIAEIFSTPPRPALVRTIHNCVFWRYWPRIGRWCDRRLARAHIACVSEDARTEFFRYRADSRAAPPASEPVVIYNGVMLPTQPPRAAPLAPNRRRVLFAGRLEYQKGTDVLCRALPLTHLPPGVSGELVCIGSGADEAVVRALAAAPPRGWTVAMRAPVPGLENSFREFDLIVVPSRFEGLGLVAIEATLCGLPVVATDAPGLRETLPANSPWRAAPGDAQSLAGALSAALLETNRWVETVGAAQRLAETRFSPAAMRNAYVRLYRRAAGRVT